MLPVVASDRISQHDGTVFALCCAIDILTGAIRVHILFRVTQKAANADNGDFHEICAREEEIYKKKAYGVGLFDFGLQRKGVQE